jgi:O-succinylbenzoic acid--CoA ligase
LPGATQLEALAKLPASAPAQDEAPPEVWVMIFTSGTTGRSKAVEITEANLRANARFSGENLGSDAEQRWLGNLPLFHVGGIAMVVRCALYGCALELEGRFDLDRTIAALHDHSITHASLVPQTLGRVLEAGPLRFSPKLRALLIGGGPSHPEVLAEARSRGLPVLQTYGLTEATSQVATERLADADGTTSGPPLPGLEVRIVDGEGRALPTGAEGDIEVRGLTVMRGYFQNPEATARTLQGGWLHTGDLGALDARGRLRVFARRSDLILSGGENVYPAELEQLLVGHPAVAEAAVVGVEDPRWGQVPVAVLVAKAQGVQPPDLDEWCRAQLAGFKVPRRWVWVNELPRNAGGKVDRAALRAMTRPAEPLRRADEARRR